MAGRRLRASLLALTLTVSVGSMAAPSLAAAAPPPAFQLATEEGGGAGGQGGEATEGGGEGGVEPEGEVTELPGPEPNFENTFAPEEFETPWHWWLGVILTAVTVLAIGGIGLGYWLLVRREES